MSKIGRVERFYKVARGERQGDTKLNPMCGLPENPTLNHREIHKCSLSRDFELY